MSRWGKEVMKIVQLFKRIKSFIPWFPVYLRFHLKGHGRYFKIFTHLTKKERLLLYKLSLSLKEGSTIVEIGSYLGASASFLACGAKEKHHIVYCVDTWKNEGMSEGERDTFEEFCKNIEPLKDYIRILRGKSADMALVFDGEIDLLFIDGDHSYEMVKLDVLYWLPKLKENGIVVFHDYGWAEGVKRVVDEYIKPIAVEELILDNTYMARIKR